jgi:hypothetical protein
VARINKTATDIDEQANSYLSESKDSLNHNHIYKHSIGTEDDISSLVPDTTNRNERLNSHDNVEEYKSSLLSNGIK